jgi:hypothetical protein
MSLESKIETLTASIDRLIEALGNASIPADASEAPPAPAPKVDKPKKAKPEPKVEPAPEPAPEPEAPPADKVTSTQVAQALVALMKDKGRDAGVAVLQQFGASKVPEIKAEDYPSVLAAIKAAS